MSDGDADGGDQAVGYRRSERALWRGGIGCVLVLPPRSSTPLLLEGAGADLWYICGDLPQTLDELSADVANRYHVEADVVASALLTLVETLVADGALDAVGS